MRKLIFATGIECSYPTIQGGQRRDQLAETRHYENWRGDLELCREVGTNVVRYGPQVHPALTVEEFGPDSDDRPPPLHVSGARWRRERPSSACY